MAGLKVSQGAVRTEKDMKWSLIRKKNVKKFPYILRSKLTDLNDDEMEGTWYEESQKYELIIKIMRSKIMIKRQKFKKYIKWWDKSTNFQIELAMFWDKKKSQNYGEKVKIVKYTIKMMTKSQEFKI